MGRAYAQVPYPSAEKDTDENESVRRRTSQSHQINGVGELIWASILAMAVITSDEYGNASPLANIGYPEEGG